MLCGNLLSLWNPSEHLTVKQFTFKQNHFQSLGKVIYSKQTSQRLDADGNVSCVPLVPQRLAPFISTSNPIKTWFLFWKILLFLNLWESRRCKSSVLLRHVSVSKQQLSSPSFTDKGQVYCKRLAPLAASVTQHHPLQRWLVCVTQRVERNETKRTPGRERWDKGSEWVERQSKAWESIWAVVTRKVWPLPAPGVTLHLLLLVASPWLFCRKSDSSMLTTGPCKATIKACVGLSTVQMPCSFCLSYFRYLTWAQLMAWS